jgi:hypothetical protein
MNAKIYNVVIYYKMYIFMNFCTPAKFYTLVTFLTLLYLVIKNATMFWFIIQAIIFTTWIFILNKLCKEGYKLISWILAIIPHIIFLLITIKAHEQ